MGASMSLALAAILFASGGMKLRSLSIFREQLADYRLLPYRLTSTAAAGITASELAAGAMLVFTPTRRFGALLAIGLLTAFLGALVHAFVHDRRIACACFGIGSDLDVVGPHTIARTAALIILASVGVLAPSGSWSVMEALGGVVTLGLVFQIAELARIASLNRPHERAALPTTATEGHQ